MPSRPERLVLALLLACSPQDGGDDAASSTAASTGSSGAASEAAPTTGDASWASLDERPCPEDSLLTTENFGGPFILTYCTGCHHSSLGAGERAGAPPDMNFDTLAEVRAHAPRIWARAADDNASMPPIGAPAADERTRLGEWLACGAPSAAGL